MEQQEGGWITGKQLEGKEDFISVECAATAYVHRGGSGDGKK